MLNHVHVTSLAEFADALSARLRKQPAGTVARMPAGDIAWVEHGSIIGCAANEEGYDWENQYEWREEAVTDAMLAEINAWLDLPEYVHRDEPPVGNRAADAIAAALRRIDPKQVAIAAAAVAGLALALVPLALSRRKPGIHKRW